jgi:hypothetical protein
MKFLILIMFSTYALAQDTRPASPADKNPVIAPDTTKTMESEPRQMVLPPSVFEPNRSGQSVVNKHQNVHQKMRVENHHQQKHPGQKH